MVGVLQKKTVLIVRSVSVFFRPANIFARESAMMKRYFYPPNLPLS